MIPIPEADWQYLRTVKDELLETLCQRINDEAARIVGNLPNSQHEKFLRLFQHVLEENKRIAACFDDWRRSTIFSKLLFLQEEQLLTDHYLSRLSEETQSRLKQMLTN